MPRVSKPAAKIVTAVGAKKEKTTRTKKTKTGQVTFLKSLPESVEHIEIVQQVAGVLEELQKRVLDVKEEASKELRKLMKRYETNYRGLEKKVHTVTLEAKRQAQTSMIQLLQKWHEHKEKLPKPVAKELEKIIEQIGARMVAQSSSKKKVTGVKKTSSTPRQKPSAATKTQGGVKGNVSLNEVRKKRQKANLKKASSANDVQQS
jgi:hypothetical protein